MSLPLMIIAALALARGALQLEPAVFAAVLDNPLAQGLPLIVLMLGGLSDILGQSVVLLANRVSPLRFVISIIAAVIVLAVSVGFWAGTIWITAALFLRSDQSFINILRVVELSYAPLLFGIFIFLPYLGNIIFRVLRIWILLALVVGVQVAYTFNFWQALLCCALGWIAYELITRLPVLPIEGLSRWWWRITTGTPEPLDIQAAADRLAERTGLRIGRAQKRSR